MEIKLLIRSQINDIEWNRCIQESPNGNIYAYTWYLDIVAPRWCALVSPDYSYVFPLPYSYKIGKKIGYHPIFSQQLGLFSRNIIDESTLHQFVERIPFDKYEIQLNESNVLCIGDLFSTKKRTNFQIDLNYNYEVLFSHYNKSNRSNCLKANKLGVVISLISFEEYWEFYIKHIRFKARKKTIIRLNRLIQKCLAHNAGFIYGAYTASNMLCATLFVGKSNNCVYTLFGDSSELGFEQRAKFAIFDQLIKDYANTPTTLDFEGSDLPNIASVFKGFGATRKEYTKLTFNKLPFFFNLLLNGFDFSKTFLKKVILR